MSNKLLDELLAQEAEDEIAVAKNEEVIEEVRPEHSDGLSAAIMEINEMYRLADEKKSLAVLKGYRTTQIILLSVIAVLALTIAVLAFGWYHEQGTIVPSVEVVEVVKEVEVPEYIAIDPSGEYSHELSADSFLLNDANYGPIWMPALADVRKNEYIPELFVKDAQTGCIEYIDDTVKTFKGIDVSIYQGDIDWKKVKQSGVDFAIIRCGFRGYVTGSVNEDANFKKNIKGAKDAGIKVGVYFFSQALTVDEALEEAEFCLDLVGDYELDYPVVYDWEVVIDKDGDTPRTSYIQPDSLTDNALVFVRRIEAAGFNAAIYTNKKTAVWKYDLSRLEGVDIWLAEYSDKPTYFYGFDIWQYSSKGSVDGIAGNVDMNISFKDYSLLQRSN